MSRVWLSVLGALLLLVGACVLFFNTPQFGRAPSGARLERIRLSPNFKDDVFVNREPIVNQLEDGFIVSFFKFIFEKRPDLRPASPLPHVKTDLSTLPKDRDLLVWFGHSSFLLQLGGHRLIVDPVFKGTVSPIPFLMTAFDGSNPFSLEDLPSDLDTILLSHDHWDHLEYASSVFLRDRVKQVVTGLGNGEYYQMWGYDPAKLHELDYYEELTLAEGLKIIVTPARHFTGRFMTSNSTEPCSFVIMAGDRRIFYSGDSGYGQHFRKIGERFGPFDLAIMEAGQYDRQWHNVHLFPEEVLKAADELHASAVLPVHNSKFVLANHRWQDPLKQLYLLRESFGGDLVTPLIGQVVYLDDLPDLNPWWEKVQ